MDVDAALEEEAASLITALPLPLPAALLDCGGAMSVMGVVWRLEGVVDAVPPAVGIGVEGFPPPPPPPPTSFSRR